MKQTKNVKILILASVLLAACLLASCFSEGPTTELPESTETPETTNGMYDEYILTEEDLAQINEAYFNRKITSELQDVTYTAEKLEQIKNSKYGKYAETVKGAMSRSTQSHFYFGKYGDCFIFGITPLMPSPGQVKTYELGEHKIVTVTHIYAVYQHEWIYVTEAYERGLLSDEDVAKLCEVENEYY